MTRKKIRYSEFPAAPPPAPAAPEPPAAEAAVPPPRRAAAPLDLARALAAARATEAAARRASENVTPPPAAARPSPGGVVVGRLTPMGGSLIVRRDTPIRGSVAIPRAAAVVSAPAPAPSLETDAAPASPSLRERARLRRGRVELLVFAVGQEWFGVELERVEEAIDLPDIRHIPEMPPAMLGVIPVRDALTPIYGPEDVLGLPRGGRTSALVFKRARGRMGIAVDDVDDVHTLDLAALRDAPGVDAADGILLGVLRYRDGLLALVDAEALITACQTVPLMETA